MLLYYTDIQVLIHILLLLLIIILARTLKETAKE